MNFNQFHKPFVAGYSVSGTVLSLVIDSRTPGRGSSEVQAGQLLPCGSFHWKQLYPGEVAGIHLLGDKQHQSSVLDLEENSADDASYSVTSSKLCSLGWDTIILER